MNKRVFYSQEFRIIDGKIWFGNRMALGSYDVEIESEKSKNNDFVSVPTKFVIRAKNEEFYSVITTLQILQNGDLKLGIVETKTFIDGLVAIMPSATYRKWRDIEYVIKNISSDCNREWVIFQEDFTPTTLTYCG